MDNIKSENLVNFTLGDFNTLMNYVEFKLGEVGNKLEQYQNDNHLWDYWMTELKELHSVKGTIESDYEKGVFY